MMFIQPRAVNNVLRRVHKRPINPLRLLFTQTPLGGDLAGSKKVGLLRLQPDDLLLRQHHPPRSLLTHTRKQHHTAAMAELTHPTIKDGEEETTRTEQGHHNH